MPKSLVIELLSGYGITFEAWNTMAELIRNDDLGFYTDLEIMVHGDQGCLQITHDDAAKLRDKWFSPPT